MVVKWQCGGIDVIPVTQMHSMKGGKEDRGVLTDKETMDMILGSPLQ